MVDAGLSCHLVNEHDDDDDQMTYSGTMSVTAESYADRWRNTASYSRLGSSNSPKNPGYMV